MLLQDMNDDIKYVELEEKIERQVEKEMVTTKTSLVAVFSIKSNNSISLVLLISNRISYE